MGRIFGTDGVRGIANGDLGIDLAMDIGRAASMVVEESVGHRPTFLLGTDTRISSDMLQAALTAGLCSAGANVITLGVVPTPAVAYLIKEYGANAGIMLSASHNPFEYNGIKIFNAQGYKLRDEQEDEIEQYVLDHIAPYHARTAEDIGTVAEAGRAVGDYIDYLKSTADCDLSGLRVAIDCSNGSASVSAQKLFSELGAACDVFFDEPDGQNINAGCGSTHIGNLSKIVREGAYDVGIAFDGDADRCLAVDERGKIVDGDVLMALFAHDLKNRGQLKNDTLVATVMSNLGLFKFGQQHGIKIEKAKVGDRYVLELMHEGGHTLGGEQSGHIIFRDFMPTGDGQLSALQLLCYLKRMKTPLSELRTIMHTYPQTLLNVHATPQMKAALDYDVNVRTVIEKWSGKLGDDGRILVRASGTEPLIRVMVEGQDLAEIERIAKDIADAIGNA